METRVAPSVRIEEAIAGLLDGWLGDVDQLGQLGRYGAQLILQRGVEDEVSEFLGRARYERTSATRGWRNGVRPRRLSTSLRQLATINFGDSEGSCGSRAWRSEFAGGLS